MKLICFVLFLLCSTITLAQQSVSGTVLNVDGKQLNGASVSLYYKGSVDTLKTTSGEKGFFKFEGIKSRPFAIMVSYVGYKPFTNSYDFKGKSGMQTITDIVLSVGENTLENITLESSKVQIKEDTVSFLIDSTMYRKNDNVEEVLKRLPGITVDKSGTVTAQGKEVTRVKVNGKDFFNGDVRTATREINADMVDKIQVIDDFGDQSAFTGIKEGESTKTLNIQLKKDKNKGYFGNVSAGAGTEDRYATSLSVNRFNNDQQISVLANLNNTNASVFNFGAIGGAMGSMISSMARGMGIGQGGGGVGATLGNFGISDGIGTTKSVGVNYRDEWGPKISAYGSYSFNQKMITTIKNITQQNSFQNQTTSTVRNSRDNTVTDNHRFSYNLEYKIDSFNYLKFSPTISYRKTESNYIDEYNISNQSIKVNQGSIGETANSKVPSFNGNLLFNHRFAARGRTLSINLSGGKSTTEGFNDLVNPNTYFTPIGQIDTISHQFVPQDNNNHNYSIRASYIEPLSKKQSVEFNYAYNYQYTSNDRETFLVNDASGSKTFSDSLSSIYDNVYITNRFGVNYRNNQKKYNYTIGLAVQPASIESNTLTGNKLNYKQHLVNFYPVVRYAYNFSKSRSFNVNYNGSTSQPSYNQLQPVPDKTNAQNIIIGNPSLRPEFTNTFSTRYNNFDFISGNVFFGNIAASFTQDKIVTNITPLGFGSQSTSYVNANGFFTVTGFYNISRPKQNRKYVFNWGGNVIYNNNVSFIEGEKNLGRNWILGQRLSLDVKIKKWLETNLAANYSFNSTKYSLKSAFVANTNINTYTISHSSRIFLPKDFIFSYDIDQSINDGYSENVNANPLIINGTLEKQFFKKKNFSVKLQAFDILNESQGINRAVTGNTITDTRTNRLARYFMLSAVLRLNKFAGSGPQQPMMPGMMR